MRRKILTRMNLSALAVLFFIALISAQTPPDTLRQTNSLDVQARFATADNLGNTYLITDKNAIEKYAPDGQFLARYSNNRLGSAIWLDVTNPLKALVWYADFRTAVFLNRSLTALGELNLISAGYPEVRTLAVAADGNLWLYDEVAFQLKKVNPEGKTLLVSQALNLLQQERFNIRCIRDNGHQVFTSDPDQGLLQFDVYGQFERVFPWKGIDSFVLWRNQIAYLRENTLHVEQLRIPAPRTLSLPASITSEKIQLWLAPGRLLAQKGEMLEQWQWQ